jgi:hypothetical protein
METSNWLDDWDIKKNAFMQKCAFEKQELIRQLDSPYQAQVKVVEDLVKLSSGSLAWRNCFVRKQSDVLAQFKSNIPMRRYAEFDNNITLEAQTKGGVLSCSPVMRWLKTSGTTGAPKRIPYTLHWMSRYRVPAMYSMWDTYLRSASAILENPYAVLDTQTVREVETTTQLSGLPYQAISNRHPALSRNDWLPPWYEAPWFDPEVPAAHADKMYYRLRHLIGKDVHFVSAINPSTLISLRDHVDIYSEKLIREIANGTIEGKPIGDTNYDLAKKLERVLGKNNFTMRDLWPSLKSVSCWTSASARLYADFLDQAYPGIELLPFMNCGTEGVVTIPIDSDLESQPLAVNQAFYEFVPVTTDLDDTMSRVGAQPETLLFDQLTVGEEYHLIMSQGNGLYRLVTGDIYRVISMYGRVPRLQFMRRNGLFHSFTGEKLTEKQVADAISLTVNDMGIDVGLYMCGPNFGVLPNYVLVLEIRNQFNENDIKLSELVDARLKYINSEYATKRMSERLGCMRVVTVPQGLISKYIDAKKSQGNGNQFKYKPFHTNIQFLDEIKQIYR